MMLRPLELPLGVSLRLLKKGVAEGPGPEMTTLSVTVPVKLFKLVREIEADWLL